jgi:hypothetical protein
MAVRFQAGPSFCFSQRVEEQIFRPNIHNHIAGIMLQFAQFITPSLGMGSGTRDEGRKKASVRERDQILLWSVSKDFNDEHDAERTTRWVMQVIVILMIISLFGVWVYNLKHELQHLRKRIPHTQQHTEHALQNIAPAPIKAPSRDGVQTWILE